MRYQYFIFVILLLRCGYTAAQFNGGTGDGFSSSSVSVFLNGVEINQIYSGGIGDGFSYDKTSTFLNGALLASIYKGGEGDGFASATNSLFLDGSLFSFYSGGIGDGFSSSSIASFLDGTSLSQIFSGGIGDGFGQIASASFLDGTTLASLYSGGNGDGFSQSKNAQFLDGTGLLALYGGGGGDGFSSESAFLSTTSLAYALWTGMASTDWHSTSNWLGGSIPLNNDDVVVDGTPVNQPVISFDVITQDLNILNGATVEVQPEKSLHIQGNLTIANAEALTLKSSASSTGYSQLLVEGIQDGPGTIKGEFYVGSNSGYRHLSSPFVTNFDDLRVGSNLLLALNSAQGNLYYWDAFNANWLAPGSVAVNFVSGKGYTVFMGSNTYGTYVSPLPITLDLSGPLQSTEDVQIILDYNTGQGSPFFPLGTPQAQTEGWNLVGNPYTSAYDWDGQTFPAQMTNEGTAVWDPATGQYAYYNNGTSINGGSRYIAPYQGVFIQTTGATIFTLEKANRTITQSPALLKTDSEDIFVSISDENDAFVDEMIIGFSKEASDDFDGRLDMWKLLNAENKSSLYSLKSGASYAINRLADFEKHKSVRMGYRNSTNGKYFILANLSGIDPIYSVELEDLLTRNFHDLRNGPYIFSHLSGNKADRFIIHINKQGEFVSDKLGNPEELVFIQGTHTGIAIDFSRALAGAKEVAIYDLVGRKLAESSVNENVEQAEIAFSIGQPTYVIVRIIGDTWLLNQKVFVDR